MPRKNRDYNASALKELAKQIRAKASAVDELAKSLQAIEGNQSLNLKYHVGVDKGLVALDDFVDDGNRKIRDEDYHEVEIASEIVRDKLSQKAPKRAPKK